MKRSIQNKKQVHIIFTNSSVPVIPRQQMQSGPSSPSCCSTSDCFPLSHLDTAACGSDTLPPPQKHEVSPRKIVSVCHILTGEIIRHRNSFHVMWSSVQCCLGGAVSYLSSCGQGKASHTVWFPFLMTVKYTANSLNKLWLLKDSDISDVLQLIIVADCRCLMEFKLVLTCCSILILSKNNWI